MDLKQHIRSIPDFPKPGILFYDISTLLAHPERLADDRPTPGRCAAAAPARSAGRHRIRGAFSSPRRSPTSSAAVLRWFASKANCPAGPRASPMISNTGPTPSRSRKMRSAPGQRVVVLDDLLATGGTMQAAINLVRQRGGGGHRRGMHYRAGVPAGPQPHRRAVHLDDRLRLLIVASRGIGGAGPRLRPITA